MWLRSLAEGLWRRADGLAHPLEARQNGGKVLTIVQVITATQPQTFTGSAVMVTSTVGGSAIAGGAVIGGTASSKTSSTKKTSATSTSTDDDSASSAAQTAAATSSNSSPTSAAATSSPSSQITSAPLVATSPTGATNAAATSSPSATSQASGGMSGGAKAGLAFGILFLIGALLAGVLMLYRRQKQKAAAGERLDDEKAAISPARPDALPRHAEPPLPNTPPQMAMAAVSRSQESLSAPRLELRPVTQFDPRMSTMNAGAPGAGQSASLGATAAGAAVGGVAAAGLAVNAARTPSPSSWEKRGAQQHANDPANPFGAHAETLNNSPPQQTTLAATNVPRAPSLGHIDAADFPLPASGQVSPKPISLQFDASTDTLPSPVPSAPATVSNVSLPVSEIAAVGVGGAAAAAATVVAGKGGNSPLLDNVHRVQLDFKPSMDDELEIRAGQLVRLLHEYDDGWALCTRMDRSQQGVVPRTCLSKHLVKPRPNGSPSGASPQGPPQGRQGPPRGPGGSPPHMRGPGPAPYGPPPHPLMPGSGRNSPAPYAQVPRPLTPTGRNSPAPYPAGGRNSPAPYAQSPRPQSPAGGPGGRGRAQSNASPYRAYQPGPGPKGQGRSMSPGPYGGAPGMMRPPQRPDNMRRRSNSMSQLSPVSPPPAGPAKVPSRKPVPGQAV